MVKGLDHEDKEGGSIFITKGVDRAPKELLGTGKGGHMVTLFEEGEV